MAVHRKTPECPFCGAPIAKAIRKKGSKLIGDNFIRWESIPHSCKKMREHREKLQNDPKFNQAMKKFMKTLEQKIK